LKEGVEEDEKYNRVTLERLKNDFKTLSNFVEKYIPLKLQR
jgi:hypothetical protein